MVACLSFRGKREQVSFSVFRRSLGVRIVVCGGGRLTRLMLARVDGRCQVDWQDLSPVLLHLEKHHVII